MKVGASDYVLEALLARRNAHGRAQGTRRRAACAKRTALCARSSASATNIPTSWRSSAENAGGPRDGRARGADEFHGAARRRKRRRKRSDRARSFTSIRAAPPARSSRSTAPPSPKICSKANCSATKKARSPAQPPASPENSSWPTRARSFSTKSATCLAATQVKLLRVLQEREFERLGGTRTHQSGCAPGRRHQSRSSRRARRRHVPRRPLLSPERRAHRHPAAARPQRRHPRSRQSLSSNVSRATPASPSAEFRPTLSPRSPPFTGPATSANCENIIERGVALSNGGALQLTDIHLDASRTKSRKRFATRYSPKA